MWRSVGRLADGREIFYYDESPDQRRGAAADHRPLDPFSPSARLRHDPLLDEWVTIAAHRQDRTFLPPPDECPLDPSRDGRRTEIPAADYDVVVFENRFPSLATPRGGAPAADPGDPGLVSRPGVGRCEVVCFTADHDASFGTLTPHRARTVIEAWADRTTALNRMPEVQSVYPFENRGEEIGVTLGHPHGQIYGYPFVPPRIARIRQSAERHRARTGANLFDDVVAAERKAGVRIVTETEHWTAFVPSAARWPYEVQLSPLRRVPDLPALDDAQRADLADVYLALLRAFDRLFDTPAPYISAWNQSPVDEAGRPDPDFGLHLQLFTLRRAEHKLKHLAGSESGMAAWINDIAPEDAAQRLREAAGAP
ncbi:UDPglucose--hexose-1-phosphate uridylyltransferase [Murinocardiopsis flavida]|uniref:Galactose-1-phosphate uridylyltransferase n=1 Tax=Murinocardiopsis flavida TaxID=645275 RepID=A0A2P8DIG4_9ACTN|nr:galactose-1-phosphate uridylyltransferase [Murinocardiopsis flavida]PSK97015.1 UDPglucose--hexose-1-phosphate uridylyltransferase [Murinocardiopsis flavida]